eukprot:PhM_4_TR15/c0_g1_i1/m.38597
MATGSPAVLSKNLRNLVAGTTTFAAQASKAFGVWKTMKDRAQEHAPEEYRLQAEVYEHAFWKRHLCQEKNFWVDAKLGDVMSRKELGEYHEFRFDLYKVMHPLAGTGLLGGWALLAWPLWFANDTWMPSTFNKSAEELREWRAAQDLYRYKFIPAMLSDYRWWYEFHIKIKEEKAAGWEEMFERNDVRRDPTKCAVISDVYAPFFCVRRKQARAIGRAMGLPTFPQFGKICLQTRIRDYWEIALTEDYMVMSQPGSLEGMTDAELESYAWRRYLAPVDKNLDRETLLQRCRDYHEFLGGAKFLETQKAPNLFVVFAYCAGYYNEPAYLTSDISELEGDDFAHLKDWGRDAFQRRLEFENGPLRDEVEAHSFKKLAERQAKLAE